VANALCHDEGDPDEELGATAKAKLDFRYLSDIRCVQRVSSWRRAACKTAAAAV
jgi:hypothetical protein